MNGNWLIQSFSAMLLAVPVYLLIDFFHKNLGVKPEAFLVWYFIGVAFSSAIFGGQPVEVLFPSILLVGAILLIGLTVGGASNILFFRSMQSAPNPGVTLAIFNSASIVVIFASVALAHFWPGHFQAKVNYWQILGVALTVAGIAIISLKR
ncbi:MAG: hypothetical protein WC745_01600 [Patescibacteria group bacterium]|jgi:drug/metabolite transporter (DMT)-like permease